MTSKDPAGRPADYIAAIRVLQNVLHRVQATQQIVLPEQQATSPTAGRAEARGGRTRVLASILGIVLLAATIGVAWLLWTRQ